MVIQIMDKITANRVRVCPPSEKNLSAIALHSSRTALPIIYFIVEHVSLILKRSSVCPIRNGASGKRSRCYMI